MRKHLFPLLLLVVTSTLVLPEVADAIPAFSRRYALPCHFCHDGYPKLSVLGEQFKDRGYRLDDDVTEVSDWLRTVPVSLRSTFRQTFEESGDAQTRGLFRLVSAGNVGSRMSYWIDDNYVIESEGSRRVGRATDGRAGAQRTMIGIPVSASPRATKGGHSCTVTRGAPRRTCARRCG